MGRGVLVGNLEDNELGFQPQGIYQNARGDMTWDKQRTLDSAC